MSQLENRGLFRTPLWPGAWLNGERHEGVELHYDVTYTGGPVQESLPMPQFEFPETTLELVAMGVPTVPAGFAPPETQAQIEAFLATMTWDTWLQDDAPHLLSRLYTWTFPAGMVTAEGTLGEPCTIRRQTTLAIGTGESGLSIGTARWLMLRQPTASRTPPSGFTGYTSNSDIRPMAGGTDDMLVIA